MSLDVRNGKYIVNSETNSRWNLLHNKPIYVIDQYYSMHKWFGYEGTNKETVDFLKNRKTEYLKEVAEVFDKLIEEIANFHVYKGRYVAQIKHGYNNINKGKMYPIEIDGEEVSVYRNNEYLDKLPIPFLYNDVQIIENPSTEEIEQANTNGETAWQGYNK